MGINDDASVKRLKGNQRPIFNISERMEVLAAIEFVDFIIPFAEETPQNLIQSLDRIDILVKGGDYRPEEVVGREEVEGCGGKLLIFPIRSQFSTSAIIERIKRDAY